MQRFINIERYNPKEYKGRQYKKINLLAYSIINNSKHFSNAYLIVYAFFFIFVYACVYVCPSSYVEVRGEPWVSSLGMYSPSLRQGLIK